MYIIAEIGQTHDGSLGIAHSFIDALSNTGVDAVKFQVHIAEAESSIFEPFRINFSYEDKTRYDYWKRMEFTQDQWAGLKHHCEEKGMDFIPSTFSNAAVNLMERLETQSYKIASGEMTNFLMLQKIAKTGKPIYLSTGMSSYKEIDQTIEFLKPYHNELTLLQCTSFYPTKPEEWGLNVIQEMKERYNIPIGFSDHSGDIFACLAAAALGVEVLEFHFTFNKSMFGPDSCASLIPEQVSELVRGAHKINLARKTCVDKNENEKFEDINAIFGKSLAINQDIKKGQIITEDFLEAKKPKSFGIAARDFKAVIGRRLKNDLKKWDFLNESDLQ